MLSAGLVAAAVAVVLVLHATWVRSPQTLPKNRERFRSVRLGAHSIRPPPATTFAR
jgi:hypothetical protein